MFKGAATYARFLRSPSSLLSLIITKKNPGESIPAAQLTPVLEAAGVPVYRAAASQFPGSCI